MLATTADGGPAFAFDYIRRDDRSAPLYAVLSFAVAPWFPFDQALLLLRAVDPRATLRPLAFTAGFLRLTPIGAAPGIPADLLAPQPLVWDGSGAARAAVELTGDAAALVGGLLEQQLLSLLAYVELEFAGVSPTLPLTVSFEPERLIAALAPDAQHRVSRDAVVQAVRERLDTLPLEWDRDPHAQPRELVAQAVANLLRTRLGTFVPAPAADGSGYFALRAPGGAGSRETWDLRTPFEAVEPIVLRLNPFDALYQITKSGGIASVIHYVAVPPVDLGALPVTISASLPDGLDARVGVELHAPPAPYRPQAIWSGRIPLDPPAFSASRTLRFSPMEKAPTYMFRISCELPDGEYFESGERPAPADPTRLALGPADLPVDLVGISGRPRLLDIALVSGAASWVLDGVTRRRPFTLESPARPVTIAVPRAATSRGMTLTIAPRAGTGAPLAVDLPLASTIVDLTAFAGFGMHTLEVSCSFPAGDGRGVIVEIQAATGGEVTTVRVSPGAPSTQFSWYAASPFEPGYRFRQHGTGEWSDRQPPFEPLRLAFDPITGRAYAGAVPQAAS